MTLVFTVIHDVSWFVHSARQATIHCTSMCEVIGGSGLSVRSDDLLELSEEPGRGALGCAVSKVEN
jgi:hypothetical protein